MKQQNIENQAILPELEKQLAVSEKQTILDMIIAKSEAEPKYKGLVISGILLTLLGAGMIAAGIIFQPNITIGLTVFLIIGGQLSICAAIGACFKLWIGNNNHLRDEVKKLNSNNQADAMDKQAKIIGFIRK